MKTRGRFFRGLAAAGLVFVTGVFPVIIPRTHYINHASFLQITNGMTQAQAEDILGVPPGDYGFGTGWLVDRGYNNNVRLLFDEGETKSWLAKENALRVAFDAQGRVNGTWYGQTVFREYESAVDWVMCQLRLRKKKDCPYDNSALQTFRGERKSNRR